MNVKRNLPISVGLFVLLVIMAVAGRLFEPAWCCTPLAAVALFAGYFFANRWAALLVPLSALAISNLWLPAYGHSEVMVVVYAALLLPVALGWALRRKMSIVRLGTFALLPAVAFYLTTNFAVWLVSGIYPPTAAGLLACYIAALPFFRSMLCGDVLYVGVVFGCYALAAGHVGALLPATRRSHAPSAY